MSMKFGNPKSLAILNENTDFGTSGARSAKEYGEKKGLKVVFSEAYSKGSPDYRSTLVNVRNANADVIFMVSYVADAILLMRQSRELGLSPKAFLGAGAGFANAQFAKETDVSHGIFSSTQWTEAVSWPGAKEFAQTYQKRYGKRASYHAATAYTAMWILAQEASKAGGDREKNRGAQGAEKDTGDGAGILMQTPHAFFKSECGFPLPEPGWYAAGTVFLPQDGRGRAEIEEIVARIVESEGQTLLGWRDVPTDNARLGPTARASQPVIRQVFVGRHLGVADEAHFERKLYVIRRLIEK